MPFEFNDNNANDGDTVMFLQQGFINQYSKTRKTPIFTAQRLVGKALKAAVSNNSFFVHESHKYNEYNRKIIILCQTGQKTNGSGSSLGWIRKKHPLVKHTKDLGLTEDI